MDYPVVGTGVQEGAMKYLMNCYQCKTRKMVEIPDYWKGGYVYCECGYPMTFIDEDEERYAKFKINIEGDKK